VNRIIFTLSGIFGFRFLLILSTLMISLGTSAIRAEHSWTLVSSIPTLRSEISSAILDGKNCVVGGSTKTELTDVVEVF
jgi:hypothetical protein